MDDNVLFSSQDKNQGQNLPNASTQGNAVMQPSVPQSPVHAVPVAQTQAAGTLQQVNTQGIPATPPVQNPISQQAQPGSLYPANASSTVNGTVPPAPDAFQQVVQGSSPQQPFVPQSQQTPLLQTTQDTTATNPRFSLEDLYGSSQPDRPQSTPQPSQVLTSNPPLGVIPSEMTSPLGNIQMMEPEFVQKEPAPVVQSPSLTVKTEEATASAEVSPPSGSSTPPSHAEALGANNGGFRFPPIVLKVIGGLFLALIAIIVLSSIAALFKGKSSDKQVTLTYWGLWEDSNVFQSIVNDFHRQNPNITISYVKQDPEKYADRLLTRMQNGTGPDIFRFHNTWVTPLQNVLLPLPSTVIDKNQLQQKYFPVVSNDLVKNGAVYGLPLEMDTLVLYTNRDIFDHAGVKVPTTWDEFLTVSKGLTVKDTDGHIKTAGAAIGTYENITHAPDIISLLLLQNGANLQKLQNSQNAIDALTFYTSFAKNDDRVWDNTLDSSLMAFSRGKVGMYFGYSYDYFAIKAAAPQLNVEVYPVPHLPGRDMSIASYWSEGVSSKSKHPKEAFLFLQYLAQKDVMAKLYTEEAKTRAFGELYPRSDLASNLSTVPLLTPFVNQAGKAVSSFFASDTKYDSFNGGLNRYLGNAVNSMLNNTSADSAIATLAQGVSQIFNQYATPSQ